MGEAAEERMVVDAENCWKEIQHLQTQEKSQGDLAYRAATFNTSKQGQIAYSLAIGLQQKLREDHNEHVMKLKELLTSLSKVNSSKLMPRITTLLNLTPTELPPVTSNGPTIGIGSVFDKKPIASVSMANFNSGTTTKLSLSRPISSPTLNNDPANATPQPKMKLGLTLRGTTFVQPGVKYTLSGGSTTLNSIDLAKTESIKLNPNVEPKDTETKVLIRAIPNVETKATDLKVKEESQNNELNKELKTKDEPITNLVHKEDVVLSVKEEHKVKEEPKITEEHKVKEEPKITDEHKVKEEPKITEEHKVTEEPKITDEHKVKEEPKNEPPKQVDEHKIKDEPLKIDKLKEDKPNVIENKKVIEESKIEIKTNSITQPKVTPKIKSLNIDNKPKEPVKLVSPKPKETQKPAEPKVKPINTDIKPKEPVKLVSSKPKEAQKPAEPKVKVAPVVAITNTSKEAEATQKPEAKQANTKNKAAMFEQKTVVEQKPLKAATKIPVKNPKPNETSKVKELEINNQIKSENKTSVETPKTIIEESVKVKEVTETVLKNEAEKKTRRKTK